MFMNDHDIQQAKFILCGDGQTPNLGEGIAVVENLKDWADANSDGWAHWQKPQRAAAKLTEALSKAVTEHYSGGEPVDVTEAELRKLLSPIKRFLTTQGVDHGEVF